MRILLLILIFTFFKGNAQDENLYDFNWNIKDSISYKTTVKTSFINTSENIDSTSESEYLTKLIKHDSNYINFTIDKLIEEESTIEVNKIVGRINRKGELLLTNDKNFVESFPSILELPKNQIGLNQKWNLKRNIEKVNFFPDSMKTKNEVIFKDIIVENNQMIAVFEYNYLDFHDFVFDEMGKTSNKYSINGVCHFSIDLGLFLSQNFSIEISYFSKDFIENKESRMSKTYEIITKLNK